MENIRCKLSVFLLINLENIRVLANLQVYWYTPSITIQLDAVCSFECSLWNWPASRGVLVTVFFCRLPWDWSGPRYYQIVKVTPHLFMRLTNCLMCTDFSMDLFFEVDVLSLSSHCIASSIKFSRSISVTLNIRWSSSRMMWSRGMFRRGSW